MNFVRFDNDWQYNRCQVLRLESDLLRIYVLPECGGKILHWVHKPEVRDYLWQHPRIKPAVLPESTNYDDTWAGGWDELFPNGGAGQHAGEFYPDHGEYWTKHFGWDVQKTHDAITLHLSAEGSVTPTRMERWITITAGSPAVRIQYRLTHLGEHPFDYLWSLHPALPVTPTCQLLIPASKGVIASPGCGRFATESIEFQWPQVPGRDGTTIDFSKIPQRAAGFSPRGANDPGYEMVYLTELNAGWYAMLDHTTRSGFGLAFDHNYFNTAWVFQTHGGWRGLHTVVVEPCTGYPYDLAEAAKTGRCAQLKPGQVVETQVVAVVFTDRERIENIDMNGNVR